VAVVADVADVVVELTPPSSELLVFNSDDDLIAVVDDNAVDNNDDIWFVVVETDVGSPVATLEPCTMFVVRTDWLLLTDITDWGVEACSCFPDSFAIVTPVTPNELGKLIDIIAFVLIGTIGSVTELLGVSNETDAAVVKF
jgi:hypothetical protein